jgi:hypothetical protein
MGKSSRMVDVPLPHLIAGGYIHYPANLAPQQRDSQCSPRFSTCWLYESIQTPIYFKSRHPRIPSEKTDSGLWVSPPVLSAQHHSLSLNSFTDFDFLWSLLCIPFFRCWPVPWCSSGIAHALMSRQQPLRAASHCPAQVIWFLWREWWLGEHLTINGFLARKMGRTREEMGGFMGHTHDMN